MQRMSWLLGYGSNAISTLLGFIIRDAVTVPYRGFLYNAGCTGCCPRDAVGVTHLKDPEGPRSLKGLESGWVARPNLWLGGREGAGEIRAHQSIPILPL